MKFAARFLPFFLIALCSIASANNIQERQQNSISQEDKIYVDQADVIFDNQGIRVFLNQNWQVTNAVFSDANGLYIVDSKGGWTCGSCGYYNTTSLRYCDNCLRER